MRIRKIYIISGDNYIATTMTPDDIPGMIKENIFHGKGGFPADEVKSFLTSGRSEYKHEKFGIEMRLSEASPILEKPRAVRSRA